MNKKQIFYRTLTAIGLTWSLTSLATAQTSSTIDIDDVEAPATIETKKPVVKQQDANVEKLEVTGSLIKRIQVEGPSPIITLDREELDRTGYNSVSDVLREITVSAFGGPKEQSGSNTAGVASVNLRGLGPERTLVLLNGVRLPKDPISGAVDLNLVPMAAVEKIEILPDGASATYGSDALGGVVNIITRTDWEGTQVAVKQTVPELQGGERFEASVVNGVNFGKTQITTTAFYRKNSKLMSRDRDFTNNGFSRTGSPGTYQKLNPNAKTKSGGPIGTGRTFAADNCPQERLRETRNAQGIVTSSYCEFKWSDFATSYPDLEQISLATDIKTELNASTRVFTRLTATQVNTDWQYAPAPGRLGIGAAAASKLNKGNPLTGMSAADGVVYNYRMVELGNRVSDIDTLSYNAVVGAERDFLETWEAKMTLSHNRLRRYDEGVSGYANKILLEDAANSGKINLANAAGERGDFENLRYVPTEESISELNTIEMRASGEVMDMESGALAMAIGAQFTSETYQDIFDDLSLQGNVFGNAGSSGGGSRAVYSAFTEFAVPLTTTWELQVAGRYDNFSDFGSTFNPKVSTLYRPNNSVLIRASGGTGFKAPKMVDLYAGNSLGYPTFRDEFLCKETGECRPTQWEVTSGGNPGLEEEKSVFASFGAAYQPTRNFMVGFDTYYVQMDNVIDIDFQKVTEAEAAGIDVRQFGITVNRNDQKEIVTMDAQMQNLSTRELWGIDFKTDYSLRNSLGRFSAGMTHSHMFFYKQELFPGLGVENILGRNGFPRYRNVISLGYSPTPNFGSFFTARTIDKHEKATPQLGGELRAYTEYDLVFNYKTSWDADISIGAKNILGTTPPLDETNGNNQLDEDLYDQIGRLVFAGYTQNF